MFNPFSLQASENLLQQIARSFVETSHRPDEGPLIITGILIATIILAYLLWKKISPVVGKYWGFGSAMRVKPAVILGKALIHRSRMDINFHSNDESRQVVSCTLYDLSDEEVILEMPFGVTPSEAWRGRVMKCFFRIPRPDKAPYFYTFSAPVLHTFRKNNIDYLGLAVPKKIELGQKRRHLRLEIPSSDIKDFRVWAPAGDALPPDEDESGRPPLAAYTPDAESLRILDISGGGIRLAFDPKHYRDLEDFVSKNPVLIMRLELGPAADEDASPHCVAARLRTNTRDAKSGALMLGYEFVEYCDRNASTFDWVKIDPHQGVDSLVNWIFKRHLELYRKKEIV
jgi:hypothetical protein